MNFKRILTSIIALVLVVCLLVNVSPVKASAASFGAGVTGWQALLYFLMVAGGIVVSAEIPTEPPAIIQQAEEAFDNHVMEMYEFYFPDIDPDDDDDTDLAQFWEDLKEGVNKCIEENRSLRKFPDYLPEGDFSDWLYVQADSIDDPYAIGVGSKLLQFLASWYMDIYEQGYLDFESLTAYGDHSFYGDWLLPDIPSSIDLSQYPCITICANIDDDGTMSATLFCSDVPFEGNNNSADSLTGHFDNKVTNFYSFHLKQDVFLEYFWSEVGFNYVTYKQFTNSSNLVYVNYDLVADNSRDVLVSASPAPSKTLIEVVEPDSFFGDYAEQQSEGELSSSDFQFPLFDFKDYINDHVDIQDQMQQLHDQIQNGQISYDDYMQSVTYDDSINDNIGGDSSETPGDSSGTGSDNDYLTGKVNALLNEFSFARSIVNTAKAIKTGLAGVTTEPPVIYIHLEDNRGSYDIGGTVPFLDLRWYAEYKPTVDALISAFLWICFAWKMLLKLPGIISGVPGDFVMDSVHHIGMSEHMPVRKAEYKVQRISNREYIRRGKDG